MWAFHFTPPRSNLLLWELGVNFIWLPLGPDTESGRLAVCCSRNILSPCCPYTVSGCRLCMCTCNKPEKFRKKNLTKLIGWRGVRGPPPPPPLVQLVGGRCASCVVASPLGATKEIKERTTNTQALWPVHKRSGPDFNLHVCTCTTCMYMYYMYPMYYICSGRLACVCKMHMFDQVNICTSCVVHNYLTQWFQ